MAAEPARQERSDAELVAAFQGGDEQAFVDIVERYKLRLVRLAHSVVHEEEEARDVVQDALIKVYHKLPAFRGESSLYTWLYRIVMNHAIDSVRRRRGHLTEPIDEAVHQLADLRDGIRPDKEALRGELRQMIFAAVDELPEMHRRTILLREVEDLSYKEIADVMKCTIGTVMSRLFYARERLRAKLTPYLQENA